MSWAGRRRLTYLSFAGAILIVLAGGSLAYFFVSREPSCFDGRENQDERGIDCGGACERLCAFDVHEPVIRWSRSFEIQNGVYSSLALIENPNPGAGVQRAEYIFRLFDSENILITERKGAIAIAPGPLTPVFETDLESGVRDAVRTFFELTSLSPWVRMEDRTRMLQIENKHFSEVRSFPRLTATVLNTSLDPVNDLVFVAIVYDRDGNALGTSRTTLKVLSPGNKSPLVFTWPSTFLRPVAKVDVIPTVFAR